MKKTLIAVSAMLLVVWYSLSVIGFDVHTCRDSGQTYIATVASGFSCEDIHPETHAHTGCKCCHSHESETAQLDTKPCCSDDFQVIVLTGVRGSQEQEDSDSRTHVPFVGVPYLPLYTSDVFNSDLRVFYNPRSGDIVPRDVMALYNIWRI